MCSTPLATHAATSRIGPLGPRLSSQVSLAVLAVSADCTADVALPFMYRAYHDLPPELDVL
jgi:hypothetical protein